MVEDDPFADATTVTRPRVPGPMSYPFSLAVCEGPETGARARIDASRPAPLLIGKSSACELRLSDRSVSRRHAAVEVVEHRLRLRDLDSTNGTYVNGVSTLEAHLTGGEILRLGATSIRVERGNAEPEAALPEETRFGTTLGASRAMRRLYPLCRRLAQADVSVILEGETGTGKEQLAESLHGESTRHDGPFVVFDCTAVAPSLIESELFGHERGAFTGSIGAHKGVFERAHGGTLMIDEVGDLPLELQPKLLRAIERLEITRVGGSAATRVDVRVIAATRRDLDREVQLNRFRDDLFHRLAVTRIALPPLRERRGDVTLLARHFCKEFGADSGAIPTELLQRWDDYGWPGNVRELRNAVARRLALGDLADLSHGDSPSPSLAPATSSSVHTVAASGDTIAAILALDLPLADARERMLDEFEQRYFQRMLTLHDGNVTRAAAAAGVGRRHFQRVRAKQSRGT